MRKGSPFVRVLLTVFAFSTVASSHAAEDADAPLSILSLSGRTEITDGGLARVLTSPERGAVVPLGQTVRVLSGSVVLGRGGVALMAETGAAFQCARDGGGFSVRVEENAGPVALETGGNLISLPPGAAVRVSFPAKGPADVFVTKGDVGAQRTDGRVTRHAAGQRVPSADGPSPAPPSVGPSENLNEPVISPSTPRN